MKRICLFLFAAIGILCSQLAGSPAQAASRFLVCSTSCTWDASNTGIWSATSGGATGASVPGSADTVTLDAATCVGGTTCTITVATDITIQSLTGGACTASTSGCVLDFSVNNNNLTVTAAAGFNYSGTGTRTLKCGLGTFSLNYLAGPSTIWNITTATNLTLQCDSTIFSIPGPTSSTRTFQGGAGTYGTINLAANSGGGLFTIVGANTFVNFNASAPNYVSLPSAATTSITNGLSWTGSSSSLFYLVGNGSTLFVPSGTVSLSWAGIRGVAASGGATFAATNSFDLGANSGITITPPTGGGGTTVKALRPGLQ